MTCGCDSTDQLKLATVIKLENLLGGRSSDAILFKTKEGIWGLCKPDDPDWRSFTAVALPALGAIRLTFDSFVVRAASIRTNLTAQVSIDPGADPSTAGYVDLWQGQIAVDFGPTPSAKVQPKGAPRKKWKDVDWTCLLRCAPACAPCVVDPTLACLAGCAATCLVGCLVKTA